MKYDQIVDDVWIKPVHNKYRDMCCDCGLVHIMSFKVDENGNIMFKAKRDNRATAAARKKFK